LVGRIVQASRGGATYASYRVWGSVGYIVVSLVSGFLIHAGPNLRREDLNPVFRFGPLLFFLVASIAFWLPDAKTEMQHVPKAAVSGNLARFLLAYFLYSIALYGSIPYLSLYLRSLGASTGWITGVFSFGVLIEVLVMTRSGALSDTWGRRPALVIAFLLLPFRLLLYVPATGPAWIAAVQSMHGFNFGIVGAVAVAFANDLAPAGTKGLAQGRLFAVLGLASAVGPALFGLISEAVGLRWMYGVAAAFAAVAAIILVFGVYDSHLGSQSIGQRRPWLRWLDAPPANVRFTTNMDFSEADTEPFQG
jgi:PPP family 3-phenylpropionic acid transporter